MRKKFNTLAVLLIMVIGSAMASVSGSHLPISSGNIGYDSVKIFTSVTAISYSGNYQTKIICKKTGDSVWVSGDTITTSGTGVKNSSVRHLQASTIYSFARVFWKDSTQRDTVYSGITFTTRVFPKFPAITVQEIPKVGISQLVITATIINGTNYSYEVSALYGDVYQYYSDTMFGITTKTDTLHLATPNANEEVPYGIWIHTNIIGDTVVLWDSLVTPRLIGDSVTALITTIGYDSVTITAKVRRDGNGSSNLFYYIKDPAALPGTYLQGYTRTVTGLGDYPVTFNGLSEDKDYEVGVVSRDTLGIDTVKRFIVRTLTRPLKPAPVARFKPGSVTLRGYIKLTGYTITLSPGDIGRAVIVRGTNDSTLANMRDSVRTIGMIMSNINQDSILMDAPHTGVRYHWRIITWSSDGVMAVSPAISAPTENYQEPEFLLDQVGLATSPNPYLQISGDGYGESAIIYVNIYDNATGQIIWSDTIDVGFGSLNGYTVQLPNLPPGDYVVRGNLRTGRGDVVLKEIPVIKRISITTGIKNNTVQNAEIYPIPSNGILNIRGIEKGEVSIFSLSGQQVYQGSVSSQVDITDKPAGKYIIIIENDGNVFRKEVVKN